ncbi:MAG: antitoxin [Actinobacteria bacterium]|nr:antitoxin [Actinomycetota bacterium]
MRTTVTLDADTAALVRRAMAARGVTFKVALNDAIRAGLATRPVDAVDEVLPVRSMGRPTVNLDQALQMAGELEDEELVRKMRTRK